MRRLFGRRARAAGSGLRAAAGAGPGFAHGHLQNSTDTEARDLDSGPSAIGGNESVENSSARWVVVVPVKPAGLAKSRLEVPGVSRAELARAIALDTLAAATACELVAQVVVVSDDPALAREAAMLPALRFVPEGESRGLDAAVAAGIAAVDPDGRMPRAALLGDLPALRPADLGEALRAAASFLRAVVPDAEGTGSTLVTAGIGVEWVTSFGDGSSARHRASGCVALGIPDASTLRRDVDTAAQLEAARTMGLGPRTAALLAGAAS